MSDPAPASPNWKSIRKSANASAKANPWSKRNVMRAIREKCLDCSCGQIVEVRNCTVEKCALFPYRLGARGRRLLPVLSILLLLVSSCASGPQMPVSPLLDDEPSCHEEMPQEKDL
jgi:hypothetical protein